jgi:hypothetical protein
MKLGVFNRSGLNSLQTARWMLWFRDASGGSDRYEFDYTD